MYLQVQCSACGHRSRKFKYDRYRTVEPAEEIVKVGWNSYGDAFYCPKCVKTWEQRNGKDRPLWGKAHTRERVYQEMVSDLLREIEYLQSGEYDL